LDGLFKWDGRFTGFLGGVERTNTLELFKIVQELAIFLRCQLKIDFSAALFGPKLWIWPKNPQGIVYVARDGRAMVRRLLFVVNAAGNFENCEERLLRNIDAPNALHAPLSFFLLFKQFALA
jgi:hypothetical protein